MLENINSGSEHHTSDETPWAKDINRQGRTAEIGSQQIICLSLNIKKSRALIDIVIAFVTVPYDFQVFVIVSCDCHLH